MDAKLSSSKIKSAACFETDDPEMFIEQPARQINRRKR
jgi:hypothetical protein